jgi:hypothetical protein
MEGPPVVNRLDARIRQYYCSLLDDVPWELVAVLRRGFGAQHRPRAALKIDRVRAGGPPRVRMPSRKWPGVVSNDARLAHQLVPDGHTLVPLMFLTALCRRELLRASAVARW